MRTNAYNKALLVKDEFFHFELYEWYLSRGMTNQLLEVRIPSSASHKAELTRRIPADSNPLPRGLPCSRADNAREDRPPLAVLRPHISLRLRRLGPRLPRRVDDPTSLAPKACRIPLPRRRQRQVANPLDHARRRGAVLDRRRGEA